jgi:gelsolin
VKPTEYKPRLLHVTGYKQKVQVYEVPLSVDSLNDSDCFVLDNGLTLFQFNGTKSNSWEKRKAQAIVQGLKASRLGKVQSEYVIDGLADKGNKLIEEFWKLLGGRPKSIKVEEDLKEAPPVTLSMHHISDASGKMTIKEVCKGKLDKSALVSDDCFIVDAGGMLFVWVGKGANKNEKFRAMEFATEYLAQAERPANFPIARVMEGKEPPEFWEAFAGKTVGGRNQEAKKWKN